MTPSTKVEGLQTLLQRFEQIPRQAQEDLLRTGIKRGLDVVAEKVKSNAPFSRGQLRKSVKVSIRKPTIKRPGGPWGEVRVRAFYGKFLEYGTDPHWIEAGDVKISKEFSDQEMGDLYRAGSQRLRRALKFRQFFGVRVWHPGIRGRGFMRRSWDESQDLAIDVIKRNIRNSILYVMRDR